MIRSRVAFLFLFLLFVGGVINAHSQAIKTVDTLSLKPMKLKTIVRDSIVGVSADVELPTYRFKFVEVDLRLPKPSVSPELPFYQPKRVSVVSDDSLRVAIFLDHLRAKELYEVDRDTSGWSFNPYGVSVNWPRARKFMPHVFSVKYMGPQYGDLMSVIQQPVKTPFDQYQHFKQHPAGADTLIVAFKETSYVQTLINRVAVHNPALVSRHWNSIPDPPKIDQDGAKMNKRSVYDGFAELLKREDPETKRKINKRQQIHQAWTWGGTENIQFSQAYLDNWVKGGENSVALLSDLRINAKYKKDNIEWENSAVHKLGVLKSGDNKGRVNDDLIELNSKYGVSASKKWFYSGLFNFKTQFFNGYNKKDVELENPLSGFMAPAYVTIALGMDYKEGKNFTLMLLPFTSKLIMVLDTAKIDQTKYKIPEDKKSEWMGGASLVNKFKWSITKEMKLSSKMDLFYEYMKSENQVQAEWEMILDMRINVFMSTRIGTYLRYFDNESDKLQFKENLSIAFRYNF